MTATHDTTVAAETVHIPQELEIHVAPNCEPSILAGVPHITAAANGTHILTLTGGDPVHRPEDDSEVLDSVVIAGLRVVVLPWTILLMRDDEYVVQGGEQHE